MKNLALTLGVLLSFATSARAHEHLAIIALNEPQITPLAFLSANAYGTNSGYVFSLALATNGTYAGHYQSGAISFTSYGIFNTTAPLPGTQVRVRFVSVTGPAGGSFGVWDVPGFNFEEEDATALNFSVPVGTTNGTNSILVSENNGEPGADPGGHIHGRHYSATKPGLYVVTVQAYDGAANGPGGTPLQPASLLLPMYFQAGDQISAINLGNDQVAVSFASKLGTDYYLEAVAEFSGTNDWQTVAGPLSGNDHFQILTDPNWNAAQQFYRLRLEPTP